MIASTLVKELRARTNCGIVDCKKALEESKGEIEGAITWLRKHGKATAAKKAHRTTHEGIIASYVHSNQKIGVLVSLLCETDFVARNEVFKELARNIALHVAAMDPIAISPDNIPAEATTAERSIAEEQAKLSGKPAAIQEKMIEGRVKKFVQERALLTQPFVKDPSKTITDLLNEAVAELGENVSVGNFSRIAVE
jgi:elongation factor Ts